MPKDGQQTTPNTMNKASQNFFSRYISRKLWKDGSS